MKKIILFFGSFDPLHKGHISILENAIKKVHANTLYIGLNKNSSKGKLTPLYHRKNMIKQYCKINHCCKLLPITFDYKNIEKTYTRIFSFLNSNDKYYILIGEDQLKHLNKWHNFNILKEKFTFIIAKRDNSGHEENKYFDNEDFIFIDHNYKNISSLNVKEGNYNCTTANISNYIIEHNLYLKEQIKKYLSKDRYIHTLSVKNTAILINKKANLGIDSYKAEKAALLHDIAKDYDIKYIKKIIASYYPKYIEEQKNILHQYVGEYIAREKFFVYDDEILKAIKYHTTGRAAMSLLEKLIFVSDKIEPTRKYDTKPLLDKCIKNFNKGFIEVLKRNKKYLDNKKIIVTNEDAINSYDYYL